MEESFLVARIILISISIIMILIFTKIVIDSRIGKQFYIILLIFWSTILIISIKPDLINFILDNIGLDNRAQFMLIITMILIIYLLSNQTLKNKGLSINLYSIVRKSALENFKEKILKSDKVQVVIVITAKNEEKTIGKVIDSINQNKFTFTYKILVVNDGSIDNTEKIAKEKNILVINHIYNLGIGAAVKTGYIASKLLKPDIVVNVDADGQHDPKYINQIVELIKNENFDLVYASRFHAHSQYNTNKIRYVGNRFYTNLINKISGLEITDVTTGFRAIKTNRIDDIFFVSENNFAIELALRAAINNLKVSEIPVNTFSREQGKSQFHKIEKFVLYNINAFKQISYAYLRKAEL